MTHTDLLEVTITHNLDNDAEVAELFRRKLIALDWGRKGPDPRKYSGRANTDVKLFNKMRENGAAVIAAYKNATDSRSRRLVGLVKRGATFTRVNGLLCLPLSKVQNIDSSISFLGNLVPRSCTVQSCHNRSKGRLAALVRGKALARSVLSLHHYDVEWLVTNYLMVTRMCECVWSGGRSYQNIDHAGFMPGGRELLAQTTISADFVQKKAKQLLSLAGANRELHFFGLGASESQCPKGIIYHSLEKIFSELEQMHGGEWLINRMLSATTRATNTNV
jgi:hypothetical protein